MSYFINSLNELNFPDIFNPIKNISFFYISNLKQIIPGHKMFTYHFFIINNKLYINDFECTRVMNYFVVNNTNITNQEHIKLLNNINFNIINIDKAIVIKVLYDNAGHAYGNIMDQIYYIKKDNLDDYKIIITEDLINFSSFLVSIIYLFFDKEQIIIVNDTTLININHTYIFKDRSIKFPHTTKLLIDKLKLINYENTNIPIYNNICLIKTKINKCQNVINKQFDIEYNNYIKSLGFEIIIPENFDIITLFRIIYNAKNVIMSWGCCSYLNSDFVNPTSNILVLCHIGYYNEYNAIINTYPVDILNTAWLPEICRNKFILYDLETEININIKEQIKIKINNMFLNSD